MDGILESKNFDILQAQIAKPVRFEDIPKPTELAPLHPDEGMPVKVKKIITPTSELGQKMEEPKTGPLHAEPSRSDLEFRMPKDLLAYINKLIGKGKKLRALAFDMEFAASNQDIKTLVLAELAKGTITEEEKKDMLGYLPLQNVFSQEKLAITDPVKLEKVEKLKTDYGIVIE